MPTGTTSNRSRSRLASTLPAETQEIACSPLRPPNTTATRTRPAMVCEGRGSPAPRSHATGHAGLRTASAHADGPRRCPDRALGRRPRRSARWAPSSPAWCRRRPSPAAWPCALRALRRAPTRVSGGARSTVAGLQLTDLGQADQVGELVERGQVGHRGAARRRRGAWRAARRMPAVAASSVPIGNSTSAKPELGDPGQRQRRGAAALGPVEHQRRHAAQLRRRPGRCRPRWSAPRRTARRRPRRRRPAPGRSRRRQALDGGGVGAGDEQEVRVAPGLDGRADLADHLVGRRSPPCRSCARTSWASPGPRGGCPATPACS